MDSINLQMKTVEVSVGTKKVNATYTREMVKDIYKMSGMKYPVNKHRKDSIEKILNYNKHS